MWAQSCGRPATFGADALITTERHSPREMRVMAKAASGALDLVPMIGVRNLGDAVETLKKRGMRVLGFDSEAAGAVAAAGRRRGRWRSCWVPKARDCVSAHVSFATRWCRLDMPGPIKSLNVSNAAAIALFAATAK